MGPKPHPHRRLTLLILFLMTMVGPVPSHAADPLPPPPVSTQTDTPSGEATPFDGSSFVGDDERAEQLRILRAAEEAALGASETSDAAPADAAPQQVQGDVRLDVAVGPARIRGGEEFYYTFTFTNTNSFAVNGVVVRAIWNNANPTNASNFMQYCSVGGCLPQNVSGVNLSTGTPQVNRTSRSFLVDYTLNEALGPGAVGSFQIAMRTRLQDDLRFLPRSNIEPVRPAGSGELYKDTNFNNKISEDTASNLVEGPVFVLSKAVTATNSGYNNQIFPTQEVEYTITLGNATGAQDRPNGVVRSDAIDATNIVLSDIFPAATGGSEYVSSDPPATVDLENERLSWTIERLRVGEQREFKVRFRKTDISKGCKKLENAFYTVSSDEMPLRTGIERYSVKGAKVGITVLPPLRIKSIGAEPDGLPYGSFTTITIVVQNLFPKAIVDGRLNYFMQNNAFFQSASPGPLSKPEIDGNGLISWRLDMQAGTPNAPSEATFSLQVEGAYAKKTADGVATPVSPDVSTSDPNYVPKACIEAKKGSANFIPRLTFTKYSEGEVADDGLIYVTEGQELTYYIDIRNDGGIGTEGMVVEDRLPREGGAAFTYVEGSAKFNGLDRDPTLIDDAPGGERVLKWEDVLDVPPGTTGTIEYKLRVSGFEYTRYCNQVIGSRDQESVAYGNRRVCVKMNPDIRIEKIILSAENGTVADDGKLATVEQLPGARIRFRLTLTNNTSERRKVGIYDDLGLLIEPRFESGNGTDASRWQALDGDFLEYPINDNSLPDGGLWLGAGQTRTAEISARLPEECKTREYINEALFTIVTNDGSSELVVRLIPPMRVKIKHNCGNNIIEYAIRADKDGNPRTVSLRDDFVYDFRIRNANEQEAIQNITGTVILPPDFSYVRMDGASIVSNAPTIDDSREDRRQVLTWSVPSMDAKKEGKIRFVARSGDVVASSVAWAVADAANLLRRDCKTDGGPCQTVDDDGVQVQYATDTLAVRPLITIEPSVSDESCGTPGDTRFYALKLLNTNDKAYNSTTVKVTLPIGLRYRIPSAGTATPRVSYNLDTAQQMLIWENLTIAARPSSSGFTQVPLEILLEVGQVYDKLETRVEVSSPDGLIPLKDGFRDPIIDGVCLSQTALGKEAMPRLMRSGEEFLYAITVGNPTASELTVAIEDVLPPQVSFVGMVDGPGPQLVGQTLTWNNLKVPGNDEEGNPGFTKLLIKVRVNENQPDGEFFNTATLLSAVDSEQNAVPLDTTYNTIGVEIQSRLFLFLPLTRR